MKNDKTHSLVNTKSFRLYFSVKTVYSFKSNEDLQDEEDLDWMDWVVRWDWEVVVNKDLDRDLFL